MRLEDERKVELWRPAWGGSSSFPHHLKAFHRRVARYWDLPVTPPAGLGPSHEAVLAKNSQPQRDLFLNLNYIPSSLLLPGPEGLTQIKLMLLPPPSQSPQPASLGFRSQPAVFQQLGRLPRGEDEQRSSPDQKEVREG